jgi:hypothetical protein
MRIGHGIGQRIGQIIVRVEAVCLSKDKLLKVSIGAKLAKQYWTGSLGKEQSFQNGFIYHQGFKRHRTRILLRKTVLH